MKTFVLNGWAASEHAWDSCRFSRERVFGYVEQLGGEPEKALAGVDGAVLVGWSMGASGALRIACSIPEKIKGLVLAAATPCMMERPGWKGMSKRRLAALEAGLRMTRGEGFFGTSDGRPSPYILDTDEHLARGLEYLEKTDLRDDLRRLAASGRLRCRMVVLQSEKDAIVRASNAAWLKSVFPAAAVEMIPGGEHALPASNPSLIDAAVASCFAPAGG